MNDVPLFVDPGSLRLLDTDWGAECRSVIQNFFDCVLHEISVGNDSRARGLLAQLREPNETHLGLSYGRSQGRALGTDSAIQVWDALRTSAAVQSGLISDLEDTILMVPGIGADIISDITTNLIRLQLIHYTEAMCAYYGISTQRVGSGPLWDPISQSWTNDHVNQPLTRYGRLLLIPKSLVRLKPDYDPGEYYRNYLLEDLRDRELQEGGDLVKLLKSGERRVYIKHLKEKYGEGKHAIVSLTQSNPSALDRYRQHRRVNSSRPLSHEEMATAADGALPDWNRLLNDVLATPQGWEDADTYHERVERLLTAIFDGNLSFPEKEKKIHNGRKRIDIQYTNSAGDGYFKWAGDHSPAPYVFVECKNYARDIANPELDQLSGRFSPRRGRLGLLVCRAFDDKTRFMQRCRDTADDDRGFIIVLDDEDLKKMVEDKQNLQIAPDDFPLLRQRHDLLLS